MRALIIRVWTTLNMKMMRWIARDHPSVVEIREKMSAPMPADYVDPLTGINTAVLLAAFDAASGDPEHQARLNACMEGVRGTKIIEAGMSMMGALISAGYPPDEAFVRVVANCVALGILTEKRLRDAQSLMTS